ncbi:hypothetical protein BCR35DRAFT_328356 [Leucosporidium creatinivorum]|uniref:MYND-type domain-containing protein n=1 Tax=Leucosporidium creatinivorum TaxID=106004 RepID=A0A1Y2G306_9BASI|nr:hypothetical protein BCR35DRAFT_328356 [Leucosporidium creatinivorum]
MDAFVDKECVVCGAATTKTCSACKKLFFCSSEHQKLRWPIHKHLCGKEGYRPPSLTESEVDWALSHPHPQYGEILRQIFDERKSKLGDPTTSDYELATASSFFSCMTRLTCHATNFPGYNEGPQAPVLCAFAWITAIEIRFYKLTTGDPKKVLNDPLLSSTLCHLLYAATLVLRVSFRLAGSIAETRAELDQARRKLQRLTERFEHLKPSFEANYDAVKRFIGSLSAYLDKQQPLLGEACPVS